MARVLVVDDSADTVAMLAFHLKEQGHQVSAAYGGEEALRLVATEPPDLVLLDVNMPGMNGLEVCGRLKAEPRWESIPVQFRGHTLNSYAPSVSGRVFEA